MFCLFANYIRLEPNEMAEVGPDHVLVKYNNMIWKTVWSDEQDIAEYAKNDHYRMFMCRNIENRHITPDAGEILVQVNNKWYDCLCDADSKKYDELSINGPIFPKDIFIIHDYDLYRNNQLAMMLQDAFYCYEKYSGNTHPIFFNCVFEYFHYDALSVRDLLDIKAGTYVRKK